jgi:hypothetical protein
LKKYLPCVRMGENPTDLFWILDWGSSLLSCRKAKDERSKGKGKKAKETERLIRSGLRPSAHNDRWCEPRSCM